MPDGSPAGTDTGSPDRSEGSGGGPRTKRPPPRKSALRNFLLPLGVVLGAVVAPEFLKTRLGWSKVAAYLVGIPVGLAIGLLAAFILLLAIGTIARLTGAKQP